MRTKLVEFQKMLAQLQSEADRLGTAILLSDTGDLLPELKPTERLDLVHKLRAIQARALILAHNIERLNGRVRLSPKLLL